ncbi:MAG: hypothetical protein U0736_20865 [Gemmataceae bacterium]
MGPIQVIHYAVDGEDPSRGLIGDRSFAVRPATPSPDRRVDGSGISLSRWLQLRRARAAGCGRPGADGRPSETTAPPRLERLRYPAGATQLRLDDDAEGGLQAYVVAAARQPLPPFAEWKRGRDEVDRSGCRPDGRCGWPTRPASTP